MQKKRPIDSSTGQLLEVLLIAGVVLLVRMLFEAVVPVMPEQNDGSYFFTVIGNVIRNYPLALLLLGLDYFLVRTLVKHFPYGASFMRRTMVELAALFLLALLAAVLMLPDIGSSAGDSMIELINVYFLSIFVFNTCMTAVIDVITYYRTKEKSALEAEVKLRSQVNYRYNLLKGQLNPHFLFNSLNVLDYLIYADRDKASDYVKKLANVYRYLLNLETNMTVQLEEELDFVGLYVDLMKERLGDALEVYIDVPQYYKRRTIVPCTLEVLLENAIKHNVASVKQPLKVSIGVEATMLVVSNVKNLKSDSSSNGVGLSNINDQYEIIFDSRIVVEDTQDTFTVRIPLFK